MISSFHFFAVASVFLDALVVVGSFWAAHWVRFHSGWLAVQDMPPFGSYAGYLAWLVPLHLMAFRYAGLYRHRRGGGADDLSRSAGAAVGSFVAAAALTYALHDNSLSRLVLGISALLVAVGVWGARGVLRRVQAALRRRGLLAFTRLLVVGAGDTARGMLRRLKGNPVIGYQLVGVLAEAGHPSSGEVDGVPVLGPLSSLDKALEAARPEEVLFALPGASHAELIPLLVKLQDASVKYRIVSDLFGLIMSPLEADEFLGVPVFEMKRAPLVRWHNRAAKRILDAVFAGVGLALAAPVMALIALGVKLTSPGPVLFKQKRVGRDGRIFTMYKFRSMRVGSETAAFTQVDDPRRTKFGVFLRRTSLDELPQLWNVLQGRMSLVGPRPEVPALVEKFEQSIPRYFERHQVKAGITGWAQVHGLRGNTSIEDRVHHDIYYIENWSLWLDIRILVQTVFNVIGHEHAY